MKTYKNLFGLFISDDNILTSIKGVLKKKSAKKKMKALKRIKSFGPLEKYVNHIRNYACNFQPEIHETKLIYDGVSRKQREIIVPSTDEQVVHHMATNILIPIIMNSMYFHNYASIPGRGCDAGRKAIEKFIRKHPGKIKYCLKMDIHQFFKSIPHDLLMEKIQKKIHDRKFIDVLRRIIGSTECGLPLGFYTSQWFANWFLETLDIFIKEVLKVDFYIRYMDDMVIFGSNKRKLHVVLEAIKQVLKIHKLALKNNYQIFRFHYIENGEDRGRFLDFMGFRFYRNKTILRETIYMRACRKAKRMGNKENYTSYDCKQMLAYKGWMKYTDSFKMYMEYINPYINFTALQRYVSKIDRLNQKAEA